MIMGLHSVISQEVKPNHRCVIMNGYEWKGNFPTLCQGADQLGRYWSLVGGVGGIVHNGNIIGELCRCKRTGNSLLGEPTLAALRW